MNTIRCALFNGREVRGDTRFGESRRVVSYSDENPAKRRGDFMRKLIIGAAAVVVLVPAAPLAAQDQGQPRPEAQTQSQAQGSSQLPPLLSRQVSRLPPLPQPLDPIMQEMFDKRRAMGGSLINLQLVTGHAPKFSQASSIMTFAIRFEAATPRRLLELAILRTAEIVGSDYEINQHRPLMKLCGYSEAQIAALGSWRGSTLFDAKQRAMLAYVEQVTHGGDVDDATFAALAAHFSPREIVEITYAVTRYYSTGLLTRALRIEIETDGRQTVAGTC
jgi:alkylhydroperoxidase family enzyme